MVAIDCLLCFVVLSATFIVHSSATTGIISLQNAKNTLNWLAIRDGKFIGDVSEIPMHVDIILCNYLIVKITLPASQIEFYIKRCASM